MRRLIQLVVAAAVATIPVAAGAQALTEAQARAAIAPWYALFNLPVQGDMRKLQSRFSPPTTSRAGGICRASAGAGRPPSRSSVALPGRSPT